MFFYWEGSLISTIHVLIRREAPAIKRLLLIIVKPSFVLTLFYQNKKTLTASSGFPFVQAERLELSHLAALDPKSSVSTNSTTPACLKNSKI